MGPYLFTSESVSEGHPDKVADQISDAVLDAILAKDPEARVACEVLVTTGLVLIAGEITTNTYVDMTHVARNTIKKVGYTDPEIGFDYKSCAVLTHIDTQSPDIARGVDPSAGGELGAGDQGMMFGYAVEETPALMPATIFYAHELVKCLAQRRRDAGDRTFLRPDSKAQVTVEYDAKDKIQRVHTVLISTQHKAESKPKHIEEFVREEVIAPTLPSHLIDEKTQILVNPTGQFVVGGPHGDCGLTGRKIIVDTYGGHGAHGGGAFSGKDPSKVDRSAAYIARHIAKNIVAAGLARKCLVQLAYAIGRAEPISIMVNDYGTGVMNTEHLVRLIQQHWSLTPDGIIQELNLLRPCYLPTAAYGHFGREEFLWEKTNRMEALRTEPKTPFYASSHVVSASI